MNHTSEDHEWAKRARAGEREYQDRYFFFDTYDIPALYEQTCPQVFPTTAPGNFTWLDDIKKHVMTTFYSVSVGSELPQSYCTDEMIFNMLYLANQGVDIVRLDAVPYIWKQLGTNCRNLPQVHTIVRMMRMICEIVCPGVLLLGEVVMAPEKVVPYFGTVDKPECHLLYNVTTMASTWHTVATRDVSLLRRQLDIVPDFPETMYSRIICAATTISAGDWTMISCGTSNRGSSPQEIPERFPYRKISGIFRARRTV